MSTSMNVTDDFGSILSKHVSVATAECSGGSTCTSCSVCEPPFVSAYMSPFTHDKRHGGTYGGSAVLSAALRSTANCSLDTSKDARLMRFASFAASACAFENHAADTDTPSDIAATMTLTTETQSEKPIRTILSEVTA